MPFAGEAKQRMLTDLFEVAVKCGALLFSVNGVFSGIHIDDESPFVSPSKQGVGGSAYVFFECPQSPAGREYLILESAERGLAGSILMLFSQGQSERRVHPEMISVIAILISCCNLIDSLAQQLEQ